MVTKRWMVLTTIDIQRVAFTERPRPLKRTKRSCLEETQELTVVVNYKGSKAAEDIPNPTGTRIRIRSGDGELRHDVTHAKRSHILHSSTPSTFYDCCSHSYLIEVYRSKQALESESQIYATSGLETVTVGSLRRQASYISANLPGISWVRCGVFRSLTRNGCGTAYSTSPPRWSSLSRLHARRRHRTQFVAH
ncbi:hypothetical protein RRG08_009102 [Elysia crispata]|uniref:Uncharacterized protein n=1 Tax=Elysia crispata TaxID=231223 RepID=A0AAE0YZM1_9GAST|nr:hypothetical protein RRG08_009102 [Elysia crispata]